MATELSIEDRRGKTAEMLSKEGFMSLAQLGQTLGVSESTIRRDLEILEEQGLVRRTHGGAVYVKDSGPHRYAFSEREATMAGEKHAIARAVAELIAPGQTVVLDGGTTCFQVAAALQGRRLNVITNSVPIASLLSADVATEVTLIGGYLYPRTGVALGAMAEQMLSSLHASQVVFSCAGGTSDGVYNSNQMMVDVQRRMMTVAEQRILVLDHAKFGMWAPVKLADWDELDLIVTDSEVDEQTRSWLSGLRPRVIFAD